LSDTIETPAIDNCWTYKRYSDTRPRSTSAWLNRLNQSITRSINLPLVMEAEQDHRTANYYNYGNQRLRATGNPQLDPRCAASGRKRLVKKTVMDVQNGDFARFAKDSCKVSKISDTVYK